MSESLMPESLMPEPRMAESLMADPLDSPGEPEGSLSSSLSSSPPTSAANLTLLGAEDIKLLVDVFMTQDVAKQALQAWLSELESRLVLQGFRLKKTAEVVPARTTVTTIRYIDQAWYDPVSDQMLHLCASMLVEHAETGTGHIRFLAEMSLGDLTGPSTGFSTQSVAAQVLSLGNKCRLKGTLTQARWTLNDSLTRAIQEAQAKTRPANAESFVAQVCAYLSH